MSGPTINYRPPADDAALVTGRGRRVVVRTVIILLGAVFLLFLAGVATFAYISHRIHREMEKAEAHILTVRLTIAGDRRFKDVRLEPYTVSGGSIFVSGSVGTAADLAALRRIVDNSRPPVPVVWNCVVAPAR